MSDLFEQTRQLCGAYGYAVTHVHSSEILAALKMTLDASAVVIDDWSDFWLFKFKSAELPLHAGVLAYAASDLVNAFFGMHAARRAGCDGAIMAQKQRAVQRGIVALGAAMAHSLSVTGALRRYKRSHRARAARARANERI